MRPLTMRSIILKSNEIDLLLRQKLVSIFRPITADFQEMRMLNSGQIWPYSEVSLGGPVNFGKWHECRFAVEGEDLWVRETYAHTKVTGNPLVVYAAGDNRTDYGGPWLSPVKMTREFSRLAIHINYILVCAISELKEEDAVQAGYRASKKETALDQLKKELAKPGKGKKPCEWAWLMRAKDC